MEHQHKINTLLVDPSTSAKKWWGISKSLYSNKCCSSLPDLIDNNIVISDSQHKAKVFNDYFVGQTIMPNADTADIPSSPHNLSIIVVNEYQVLNILYNLDISKACGFDNISNKALKRSMHFVEGKKTYINNIPTVFATTSKLRKSPTVRVTVDNLNNPQRSSSETSRTVRDDADTSTSAVSKINSTVVETEDPINKLKVEVKSIM
jgi:hypothetical protein